MATDIKVPTLGESISEGTIARWLKKDGDVVRAEEPVLELETEKATAEIAAPASGALRIAVPEGKTVPIGAVVGSIEEVSAARSSAAPGPTPAERQDRTAPSSTPLSEPAKILSPAARRLASERGLDIASLKGTGPGGRVTKEDVLDHLERGSAPAAASVGVPAAPSKPDGAAVPATIPVPRSSEKTAARETRQRMSAIRQRIADRLVSAQRTAAILTTFNEADLSAVIALRERFKDAFKEKHGVGLGFMSFFVKATIEALRAFPTVNAWIDGSDIVYHD